MKRSNKEVIASLENAAQISRTTDSGKGAFDVANYLQELADSVRKLDHELASDDEMDAIACFHSNMLVTA